MGTLSSLLAICDWEIMDSPHQVAVLQGFGFVCSVLDSECAATQTVDLAVIWDAITSMWRHYN